MSIATDYIVLNIATLQDRLALCLSQIRDPSFPQFDTIVFTGVSGALMAPLIAAALSKHLIVVRKEPTHSTRTIEGWTASDRWLFVDDFRSTGTTYRRVAREMSSFAPYAVCVGTLYYHAWLGDDRGVKFDLPEVSV